MDDLISRKAAIDALFKLYEYQRDIDPTEAADLVRQGVYLAEKKIEQLPSAQQDSKETSSTHKALDTISRQAVIEINRSYHGQMPNEVNHRIWKEINELPSAQPETHEERTETHACDCISRQAAIDAHYEYCNKHPDASFPVWSLKILKDLPPAQPEQTNSWYINSWCNNCKEYDKENKCCPRYNRVIKQTLDDAYRHGETEAEARFHAQQRWIPCSERLPEHRLYVLVTYKYEYGLIDNGITWYSETENKWNTSREVIAWMPLPEPYREEGD